MDVDGIRDGLKTALETVTGLRAYDTFNDDITVTTVGGAVVVPDDPFIDYLQAMQGGLAVLNFRVVLLASRATERTGQDTIDALLSAGTGETKSVVDALRANKTLGGKAHDTVPHTARDYGTTEIGDVSYTKADLLVRVQAART